MVELGRHELAFLSAENDEENMAGSCGGLQGVFKVTRLTAPVHTTKDRLQDKTRKLTEKQGVLRHAFQGSTL